MHSKEMKVPTRKEANGFISQAQEMNPGPWVQHSVNTARAAEAIANYHPKLDPETAFILGYLHDIGRRAGVTDMRHTLDGYLYLNQKGFDDAARICLTHSLPVKHIDYVAGKWDCSDDELEFIREIIAKINITPYDRLIQLCDALALPTGFCLIEKRIIDVAIRHGVNEYSVPRWQGYIDIQGEFEQAIGRSIYQVLPGVVENTFGFDPRAG